MLGRSFLLMTTVIRPWAIFTDQVPWGKAPDHAKPPAYYLHGRSGFGGVARMPQSRDITILEPPRPCLKPRQRTRLRNPCAQSTGGGPAVRPPHRPQR